MADVALKRVRVWDLDEAARQELFAEILDLDCRAFEPGPIHDYWKARPRFFDEVRSVMLARDGDLLVGFGAYQLWVLGRDPIVYYDVTAVDPAYRRQRVAMRFVQEMTLELFEEGYEGWYVTCRTQNPAVAQAWCDSLGRLGMPVYPITEPAPDAPGDIAAVAAHVSQQLDPGVLFDETRFVQRRVHTTPGGRYSPTDAQTASPEVQRFFEELELAAGDAVVVVVPFGAVPVRDPDAREGGERAPRDGARRSD